MASRAENKRRKKQSDTGMANRPSPDGCPCIECLEGCFSPFTCDRYMEWCIPEELQEKENGSK